MKCFLLSCIWEKFRPRKDIWINWLDHTLKWLVVRINFESEQIKLPNPWMQLYSQIVILWHLYAEEACWQPEQLGVIAKVDVVVIMCAEVSPVFLKPWVCLCSYLSMMFIPCNVSNGMHFHTMYVISHSWVWAALWLSIFVPEDSTCILWRNILFFVWLTAGNTEWSVLHNCNQLTQYTSSTSWH